MSNQNNLLEKDVAKTVENTEEKISTNFSPIEKKTTSVLSIFTLLIILFISILLVIFAIFTIYNTFNSNIISGVHIKDINV